MPILFLWAWGSLSAGNSLINFVIGAASLISEAIWGLLTSELVRQFCHEMLYFPGETLGINEALWPQGAPH